MSINFQQADSLRAVGICDIRGEPQLVYLHSEPKSDNEKVIEAGNCFQVPNSRERECLYIVGPSGSGKSTYADRYYTYWKMMNPNNNAYLFSQVHDDNFKDIIRIDLNTLIGSPVTDDEIPSGSLLIFDDIEDCEDTIRESIRRLQHKVLRIGRHKNLYICILCHMLIGSGNNDNRLMYNECTSLTVFPRSGGNRMQLFKILKDHFGLDNVIIDELLATKSRWLTISKRYNMYSIEEHRITIL